MVSHVLAAVIWLGGLFFVVTILGPCLASLEQPVKFSLAAQVLKRFFPWVWGCIVILLGTGFVLLSLLGGFGAAGISTFVMMALGIVMMAVFKFIFVAPYKHLLRGIEEQKWVVADYALGTIRKLAMTNLIIGIIIVAVAFS